MLKTLKILAMAAALAQFQVSMANAATVSGQNGTVLIGQGDGFAPLNAPAEVAPGTRIMVRPGGMATVTYAGNCVVRLGSGLWMVQSSSPCPAGKTSIDFTSRMNQQTPPPGTPPVDPLLIAGGLAVGGGALYAVISSSNNNSKPASP
jgi:hypothetical protein